MSSSQDDWFDTRWKDFFLEAAEDKDMVALCVESQRLFPNYILGRSVSIDMSEEARLMKTPERAHLTREEQATTFFARYREP
jgi:hypothetical protein